MTVRVCALLLAALAAASGAEPIVGDWSGTLKPGNAEMRIILHVKSSEGKLSASLDSIDQGVKGIPVDNITFADRHRGPHRPRLDFLAARVDAPVLIAAFLAMRWSVIVPAQYLDHVCLG